MSRCAGDHVNGSGPSGTRLARKAHIAVIQFEIVGRIGVATGGTTGVLRVDRAFGTVVPGSTVSIRSRKTECRT